MSEFKDKNIEQLSWLDRDSLLMAWREAAADLQSAKEREHSLRMLAFNKAFAEPQEGTNNLELGSGWLLKATYPFNYKVDNTKEMLTALGKIPDDIRPRLVKWKPNLSISEFNKLEKRYEKIFAPFVTRTPGSPQLQLLAPGEEGNKR